MPNPTLRRGARLARISGIDTLWENLKLALFPLKCLSCGRRFQPRSRNSDGPGRRASLHPVTGGGVDRTPGPDTFSALSPSSLFADAMAEHLCPACIKQFRPTASPCCVRCGIMFASREGRDHVCGDCLDSRHDYGMARSVGEYDPVLMAIIHRFKYRRRVNLARPLSRLLLHTYCRFWQAHPVDVVFPVPLHRHRMRQRGFNQVYLLLRPWRDPIWQQVLPRPLAIDPKALQRRRHTAPQTGLGRQNRKQNVSAAFRLTRVDAVAGKNVLLVDDVYTTGATVDECARIIRRAGAERVDVLTIARAV